MSSMKRLCACLALVLAAGCSDDDVTGGGDPANGNPDDLNGHELFDLETEISRHEVVAGETVTVACIVRDEAGIEVEKVTKVWLSPQEGIAVSGHTLVTQKPGTYKVACALSNPPIVDTDFEILTVKAGTAMKVEAVADPGSIEAGGSATITCIVTDELGNEIDVPTSVITDEGLAVDDHQVSGTEPGEFEVRCEVDGKPKIENIPTSVTVTSTEPATLDLIVTPEKDIYGQGDTVTFSWTVHDTFGNELPDADVLLTAPTEGIKQINDTKFKLNANGWYTFEAHVVDHEDVRDEVKLVVDFSPPEIVITWPERGDTVQGGADENVLVEGYVTDAGGIASFTINNQEVELDDEGNFTFPMPPKWGLNVIDATAVDIAKHETRISPSYYYSTAYMPYEGATAGDVKLPDGMDLLLGQAFLDDGVHDPAEPNDLATLMELLLGSFDLNGLIPGLNLPSFGTTLPGVIDFAFPGPAGTTIDMKGDLAFEVVIGQPQLGKPTVSLDSREGGIDMGLGLGTEDNPAFLLPISIIVSVPVTLTFSYENPFNGQLEEVPFDVTGTATIETGFQIEHIGVVTRLDIALAPGGQAEVGVSDIELQLQGVGLKPIESLVIDFGDLAVIPFLPPIPLKVDLLALFPQITDLFDLLVLDPFIDAIEPQISGLIEPLVDQLVGAVLEPLLNALNLETTLPLPNLLGGPNAPPIDIGLALGLSSIHFTDDGGQIGLGAGLAADKGVEREPLGMPLRDGCMNGTGDGSFAYGWDRPVGIAGRTDLVNELLFTLWWSGALNNTLDGSALGGLTGGGGGGGFSLEDLVITPNLLLPPIANDCNKAGLIEIQAGDVYLDVIVNAFGFNIDATIIADISLQASIIGGPDGLTLQLGEFTMLDIEVVEVGGGLGGLFDVEELITSTLVPMLEDNVAGLSLGPIALPGIPLDGLLPGIPAGTTLQLGDLDVTKQAGYLIVGGALQ